MREIVPVSPGSWCRIIASATLSACAVGAPNSWSCVSAMKPPWNSKERCVVERLGVVVPMSWKRQVSAQVSRNEPEGVSQVGKCCVTIVCPVGYVSRWNSEDKVVVKYRNSTRVNCGYKFLAEARILRTLVPFARLMSLARCRRSLP